MSTKPLTLDDIDTPALIVDLDIVENNLKKLADLTGKHGVVVRPHIKTHKAPYFSYRQLALGAPGIAVATLGEAEVMANAGITDILLAYQPVGPIKLRRLAALMERVDMIVALDSFEAAKHISDMCVSIGRDLNVYIDVNTGLDRMGLLPGEPSVELAVNIHALPGLNVIGVMSHCGHIGSAPVNEIEQGAINDAEELVKTADKMREAGVPITVVSPGSTNGAPFHPLVEGITEIRPGTYIFNDVNTVKNDIADWSDCAVTILSTVVSTPSADRAVIDAGSKALSRDLCGKREGFGLIKEHPQVTITSVSEEHGVVALTEGRDKLTIGERIEVIPNHVCVAVNLADEYVAIRNGKVVGTIPVAARGKYA